jgi:hypothetical protein
MVVRRHFGNDWRNTIWKIISNPAIEVVAAIVVVLFAAWLVVSFESERNHTLYPIPGVHL